MIYDKNFVYFLGFLWSDGFIERYRISDSFWVHMRKNKS